MAWTRSLTGVHVTEWTRGGLLEKARGGGGRPSGRESSLQLSFHLEKSQLKTDLDTVEGSADLTSESEEVKEKGGREGDWLWNITNKIPFRFKSCLGNGEKRSWGGERRRGTGWDLDLEVFDLELSGVQDGDDDHRDGVDHEIERLSPCWSHIRVILHNQLEQQQSEGEVGGEDVEVEIVAQRVSWTSTAASATGGGGDGGGRRGDRRSWRWFQSEFIELHEVIISSNTEETIDARDSDENQDPTNGVHGTRDKRDVEEAWEHNSKSEAEVDQEGHHFRDHGFGEMRVKGENGSEIEKLLSDARRREDTWERWEEGWGGREEQTNWDMFLQTSLVQDDGRESNRED
jgi:hypothetical protein